MSGSAYAISLYEDHHARQNTPISTPSVTLLFFFSCSQAGHSNHMDARKGPLGGAQPGAAVAPRRDGDSPITARANIWRSTISNRACALRSAPGDRIPARWPDRPRVARTWILPWSTAKARRSWSKPGRSRPPARSISPAHLVLEATRKAKELPLPGRNGGDDGSGGKRPGRLPAHRRPGLVNLRAGGALCWRLAPSSAGWW